MAYWTPGVERPGAQGGTASQVPQQTLLAKGDKSPGSGKPGFASPSVSSERQMLRAHDERNRDKCSWCGYVLVACTCPDRDDPYLLDGGTVGTEHEQ